MCFFNLTLLSHWGLSVCVQLVEQIFLSVPLLFFLALPRRTVEILCCGAKALHLPVITSHPSLPRLLGVKPPVPHVPLCFTLFLHPCEDMWSLCWVHPELYTWSWLVMPVCEHCCCCDACRLLLAVPWVAQAACTLPHNATFTHALTLPCLQERTGRPCLNRMHLVCLPAQGQGQLATWLQCQTGLTQAQHVTAITRGQLWRSVYKRRVTSSLSIYNTLPWTHSSVQIRLHVSRSNVISCDSLFNWSNLKNPNDLWVSR